MKTKAMRGLLSSMVRISLLISLIVSGFLAVSCSFGYLPSWKAEEENQALTNQASLSILIGSSDSSGSGERAVARGDGFLYLQTGLASADATLRGPYSVTPGSVVSITDIPPGSYPNLLILYLPAKPSASLSPIIPASSGISDLRLAIQGNLAGNDSILSGATFGLVADVILRAGETTPVSATLVPATALTPNAEGIVNIAGKSDELTRAFVRLTGLKKAFGTYILEGSKPIMTVMAQNPSATSVKLAAVGLYGDTGTKLDFGAAGGTFASGAVLEPGAYGATATAWTGGDEYYFYIEFTGETVRLLFSTAVVSHAVTFDANGGTGTMAAQRIAEGTAANLSPNAFTRTGYSFLGWSTDSAATSSNIADGASFLMKDADVTLYAIWSKNATVVTHAINYDANGGSGTMESQTVAEGSAVNLSACCFSRSGFTFIGWGTAKGTTTVAYGDTASFGMGKADVTLYAVWQAITHTVIFDANGGTGTTAAIVVAEGQSATLSANAFTRSGYTFLGWSMTASATAAQYENGSSFTMGASDVTLYAVWQKIAIKRMIGYDANGGTGTVASSFIDEGTAITLGENAFARSGYTFLGWSTTQVATVAQYAPGSLYTVGSADITFYAVWKDAISSHTVSFSANNGTGTMSSLSVIDGQAITLSKNAFTRTGYAFSGWATSPAGTALYGDGASYTMGTADVTLYAVWNTVWTLSFDANGGTGSSMGSVTGTTGTNIALPYNGYSRANYTFLGWSTNANATAAIFKDHESYTIASSNVTLFAIWAATHAISFDLNGGTGTLTGLTVTEGCAATLPVAVTRSGHTFLGWATSAGATTAQYATQYTMGTSDVTLYAVWQAITHTIAFDANGGTGTVANQTVAEGNVASLPIGVSRLGYTFIGWATSSTATSAQYTSQYTMGTADVTLYAVWQAITHTVKFDANGGSGTMASIVVAEGQAATLSANAFTRSGYSFLGWATTQAATAAQYANGSSYPMGTADVTLYAVWQSITHTIKFDANGGTGTMASVSVGEGSSVTLGLNAFTRQDYTFIGWATTPAATVAQYADGVMYTVGSTDITFYAVWKNSTTTHSISFSANNGTGTMANQSVIDGQAVVLSANGFSRSGFAFAGWATSPTGTALYGDGSSYTMGSADVTLYAVWDTLWTVSFDANGGTGSAMGTVTGTTGTSVTLPYSAFTRESHIFLGWSSDANATVATFNDHGAYTITSSSVTLYAIWAATHSVYFDLNGGAGTLTGMAVIEGSAATLPTGVTRSGHTFLGWATSAGATSAQYTTQYTMGTSNVTLYAVWQAITHLVKFDLNGGTETIVNQTVAEGNVTALPSGVTRSGHTFLGWATGAGATSAQYTTQYTMGNADVTLYAVWQAITHTITFDGNSGAGTMAGIVVAEGQSATLPANAFTRTGYAFLGWAPTQAATVVQYANGASYPMGNADVTLYAVWQAITHSITFDANGGTGIMTGQTVAEGNVAALPSGVTKSGYTFLGWATSAGATSAQYTSQYTMGTSDVTLYAVWQEITHAVIFDANNGAGTMATLTVAEGKTATLTANAFTRTGYTFLGWSTSSAATVQQYANGAQLSMGNADVTLYAVWQKIIVNRAIGYDANGGTGTMAPSSIAEGTSITLGPNEFTRTNYTFLGWATSPAATVAQYADGASYTVGSADITFYAVWKDAITNHTIAYDANEGTGSVASTVAVEGQAVILNANVFERSGYAFIGWATSPTGSSLYVDGASYTMGASDVTLYAVWALKYTLTFNANGGTGTVSSQTLTAGSVATLPTSGLTYAGHTFFGWATSAGASEAEYTTGYTMGTANVTLYAVWLAIPYTITFDANGGTGTVSSQTLTVGGVAELPTSGLTYAGHTFLGWATSAGASEAEYATSYAMGTANVTLYAVWLAIPYTITFDANGGTGTLSSQTLTVGSVATLPTSGLTYAGHAFLGWATSAGATSAEYVSSYTMGTSSVALYAVWQAITHTITYDANGGTGTIAGQTVAEGGLVSLPTTGITKAGYSFVGWSSYSGASGAEYTSSYAMGTSNVTLYAVWLAIPYTLTFDANGGTGTLSSQTLTVGGVATLPTSGVTYAGHTFLGWATSAGATSAEYVSSYAMGTSSVTLYAVWQAITHTITYDANGGTGTIAGQTVAEGELLALPTTGITRAGYGFVGWSSYSGATSAEYTSSYTMGTANVILYAVWSDTTAPTISMCLLQNGDAYAISNQMSLTVVCTEMGSGIKTVTVTGDAGVSSVTSVSVNGVSVPVTVSGSVLTFATPQTLNNQNIVIPNVAFSAFDGEKSVSVKLTDNSGLFTSSSDTIILDLAYPSMMSALTVVDTTTQQANYARNQIVDVSILANDANGIQKFTLSGDALSLGSPEVYVDGTLVPSTYSGLEITLSTPVKTTSTFKIRGINLAVPGSNTLSLTATDSVGRIGGAVSGSIVFDDAKPSVSIENLTNFQCVNTSLFTIVGYVQDTGSGIASVKVSVNGGLVTDVSFTGTTYSYECDLGPAEGQKTVMVTATDNAGNAESASRTFVLDLTVPTFATPVLADSDTYSIIRTNNQSVRMSMSSFSDDYGVKKIAFSGDVSGFSNNKLVIDGVETTVTTSGTTIDLPASMSAASNIVINGLALSPGDGQKNVVVTVTDNAGNSSSKSCNPIILDITAPVNSGLTLISQATGYTQYTNSVDVYLKVSAFIDDYSAIRSVTFTGDVNIASLSSVIVTFDGTPWSSAVSGNVIGFNNPMTPANNGVFENIELTSGDGLKTIGVCSTDDAGNVSSIDPVEITLDTAPPSLSDFFIYSASGQFSFTPSDALSGMSTYSVYLSSLPYASSVSDPTTLSYSAVTEGAVAVSGVQTTTSGIGATALDGYYDCVKLVLTDKAGNARTAYYERRFLGGVFSATPR